MRSEFRKIQIKIRVRIRCEEWVGAHTQIKSCNPWRSVDWLAKNSTWLDYVAQIIGEKFRASLLLEKEDVSVWVVTDSHSTRWADERNEWSVLKALIIIFRVKLYFLLILNVPSLIMIHGALLALSLGGYLYITEIRNEPPWSILLSKTKSSGIIFLYGSDWAVRENKDQFNKAVFEKWRQQTCHCLHY